jgi:hypothetical protein
MSFNQLGILNLYRLREVAMSTPCKGYRKDGGGKTRTKRNETFVLVLGKPFNLFTVPLSSKALRVKGQLGQRSLTFAELFNLAETAR